MNVELINIGTELLCGPVLNTHQQWIGLRLAEMGARLIRQTSIPDSGEAIETAVRDSLARVPLVLVTGGLGPTSDDLTRERIAGMLGRSLREDPSVLAHVAAFFETRKRPMPHGVRVQALVPDGARVLPNANGTAPGLVLEVPPGEGRANEAPRRLILLPGPPRELRPMFDRQVAPLIREQIQAAGVYCSTTLRTTGLGESLVEEKIDGPLKAFVAGGGELGYCARTGEVDVRVAARGVDAAERVAEAARIVRGELREHVFGEGTDRLEEIVVRLLTERRQTLALAESCTGGFLASRITDVPGASEVFRTGFVTYSNEAKQAWLEVDAITLSAHGAVSEPVVRQMAAGARRRAKADYALAVTGIAGPSGGTPLKPVGTVFIGLATAAHTFVLNPANRYDRATFKFVTTQQALDLLRRVLLRGSGAGDGQ